MENIMKYVIRVTEVKERDIVVESDSAYPVVREKLHSLIQKHKYKFFDNKITNHTCTYSDRTDITKKEMPEYQFNDLTPDFVFLEEENTVRARQYAQSICELFEEILDKHNITIPDPDRNSQGEDEEAARIYGETYFNLEDDITNMITDIINKVKRDEIEVISDTY